MINLVDEDKFSSSPFAMAQLTDENFEEEIQKAQKPVLVDFYSIWCSPCQALSPILEKVEKEMEDKIILAKVDINIAPLTAQKFGIEQIPTVVLFNGGKPVSGFIGLKPESVIKEWIDNNL
jgi:thioredoxin 1